MSISNPSDLTYESLAPFVGKIIDLPMKSILTTDNVRSSVSTGDLAFTQLVASIREFGILSSLVVELVPGESGAARLVCVAGHRRLAAARSIEGMELVPCLVARYAERGARVGAALAENLNREDLHVLDIAEGYAELLQQGWSEVEIARYFSKEPRTIRHYLKLTRWPDDIKRVVRRYRHILTTRVVIREFAYRSFATPDALRDAIRMRIAQADRKCVNEAPKAVVERRLQRYFARRDDLTDSERKAVVDALTYLRLLERPKTEK